MGLVPSKYVTNGTQTAKAIKTIQDHHQPKIIYVMLPVVYAVVLSIRHILQWQQRGKLQAELKLQQSNLN